MKPSRVNIVGAGVAGLSCAYRFAKSGHIVSVISSSRHIAASSVATGISTVKGHRVPRQRLFRMKMAGHAAFAEQLEELREFGVIFGKGVSEPYIGEDDYESIFSRVYGGRPEESFGNKKRWFASNERTLFSKHVTGCFTYPNDLWCDAPTLLSALKAACISMNVTFIDAEVDKIVAESSDNFGAYQINADIDIPRADENVLCLGAQTPFFLQRSGFCVDGFSQHEGATMLFASRSHEDFAVVHHKDAFVHANGSMRVGAADVSPNAVEILRERTIKLMNDDFVPRDSIELCVGTRLRFTRMRPFLGKANLGSPRNNPFWVVGGLYKNGFQLADFIARNLVIHVNTGVWEHSDIEETVTECSRALERNKSC